MRSVDHILSDACKLPPDQRLTLVNRILEADEPSSGTDVEKDWDITIQNRIAWYDQGKTSSRSAGEVFADLDEKLQA